MIPEALAWPTRAAGVGQRCDEWPGTGAIAPVTVTRVCSRVGLNHRLAGRPSFEEHSAATGLLTERTVRLAGGVGMSHAARPPVLCSLDSFYVGKLKGVGKVWPLTGCEGPSSYGWAPGSLSARSRGTDGSLPRRGRAPGYRAAGSGRCGARV